MACSEEVVDALRLIVDEVCAQIGDGCDEESYQLLAKELTVEAVDRGRANFDLAVRSWAGCPRLGARNDTFGGGQGASLPAEEFGSVQSLVHALDFLEHVSCFASLRVEVLRDAGGPDKRRRVGGGA